MIPFAGDGFSAPRFAYNAAERVEGDAGGGVATVTINMDPDYISVIDFATAYQTSMASDVVFKFAMSDDYTNSAFENITGPLEPGSTRAIALWRPPMFAMRMNGFLQVEVDNTAVGDDLTLMVQVLVFDREALNRVPMRVLAQNLTRR